MTVPTDGEVLKLRRLTNEADDADTAPYPDLLMREYLVEAMCVPDINGANPELDGGADNPDFIPAYDFHRAAAKIWLEKAGANAHRYDYSADGGKYSESQWHEMCMKQHRSHLAKRSWRTVMVEVS